MFDDDFIATLDKTGLSEEQKTNLCENLYDEFEDRLGEKLGDLISDEQFAEFEMLVDRGDDDELDAWLDLNAPEHEQISDEIFEQLKQEALANPQNFLAN